MDTFFRAVISRPKTSLLALILISVIAGSLATQLEAKNAVNNMLIGGEEKERFDHFVQTFGSEEFITIGFHSENGVDGDMYSSLYELTKAIEQIRTERLAAGKNPLVRRVMSLANVPPPVQVGSLPPLDEAFLSEIEALEADFREFERLTGVKATEFVPQPASETVDAETARRGAIHEIEEKLDSEEQKSKARSLFERRNSLGEKIADHASKFSNFSGVNFSEMFANVIPPQLRETVSAKMFLSVTEEQFPAFLAGLESMVGSIDERFGVSQKEFTRLHGALRTATGGDENVPAGDIIRKLATGDLDVLLRMMEKGEGDLKSTYGLTRADILDVHDAIVRSENAASLPVPPPPGASEEEIQRYEREVKEFAILAASNPRYSSLLISKNAATLAIVVWAEPLHGDDNLKEEFTNILHEAKDMQALRDAAEKREVYEYVLAGPPAFVTAFQGSMMSELRKFIPITLVILLITLTLIFRNGLGVILPVATVLMAMLWTLAIMYLSGKNINMTSTIIPPVLLTVGIANVIHVVAHYQEIRIKRGMMGFETVLECMNYVYLPCLLTSVTTSVGFLSLVVSPVAPIQEAGIFIAVGVMLGWIIAMIFPPCAIRVLEESKFAFLRHLLVGSERRFPSYEKFLGVCFQMVIKHKWRIWGMTVFISLFFGFAITQIKVETNLIGYFKESTDIVQYHKFFAKYMAGVAPYNIVIESEPGMFRNPAVLREVENFQNEMKADHRVHHVFSFIDVLETIEEQRGTDHEYKLPSDENADRRMLTWTYLLVPPAWLRETMEPSMKGLFARMNEGGSKSGNAESAEETMNELRFGMEALVSEDFSSIHLPCRLPDSGNRDFHGLNARTEARIDALHEKVKKITGNDEIKFIGVPTGTSVLFYSMVDVIVDSQIKSLTLAVVIITILMTLLFKSVRIGLASMIPNLVPVIMLLGVMGLAGVPLNITTCMIASVAIGLAVDDTIHYITRYQKEYNRSNDYYIATRNTLAHGGKAMIITSIVVFFGFAVLVTSYFLPNIYLGTLVGFTMVNALVGDLIILPVVLRAVAKNSV
ncbi:MAG: MMPL family transporter [Planctomycetes bacterium]|nr:MMPL family transporter [Planctomycetota bacterium]